MRLEGEVMAKVTLPDNQHQGSTVCFIYSRRNNNNAVCVYFIVTPHSVFHYFLLRGLPQVSRLRSRWAEV